MFVVRLKLECAYRRCISQLIPFALPLTEQITNSGDTHRNRKTD